MAAPQRHRHDRRRHHDHESPHRSAQSEPGLCAGGAPGRHDVRSGRRVSASAVAEKITGGGGQYAIFAMEESCSAPDPLEISGSNVALLAWCTPTANSRSTAPTTSLTAAPPLARPQWIGQHLRSGAPRPRRHLATPLDMASPTSAATGTWSSDVNLGSESGIWIDATTLEPGTYCSDGNLQLSGSDITGEVTLVARGECRSQAATSHCRRLRTTRPACSSSPRPARALPWTSRAAADRGKASSTRPTARPKMQAQATFLDRQHHRGPREGVGLQLLNDRVVGVQRRVAFIFLVR